MHIKMFKIANQIVAINLYAMAYSPRSRTVYGGNAKFLPKWFLLSGEAHGFHGENEVSSSYTLL